MIYNGENRKIIYNGQMVDIFAFRKEAMYELTGSNVITAVPINLTASNINKFFGTDATLTNAATGVNFAYTVRDQWYKLGITLQPNTNYKGTITVDKSSMSGDTICFGVRDGSESTLYGTNLLKINTSALTTGIAYSFEFTTPETLGDTSGIMLGILSNTTGAGTIAFKSITLNTIVYRNLDHMKWISIGDSITAGVGTKQTYRTWVCNDLGVIDTNSAHISGGSIAKVGDGTLSGSGFTFMPDFIPYNVKKIYTRPILITVLLGTNDHIADVEIGEKSSTDITEFYGALNYFYDKLMSAYPNAYLMFFTPFHKKTETANEAGYTLQDYIAAIKDFCNRKDIYCYDTYTKTKDLIDITTNTADGLHLNYSGHEIVYPYIEEGIRNLVLGGK